MKRNKNRIFLLLLTVMLVIGVWSGSALAVTAVDPSDTLLISIKIGEKTTDLHTYDKSELEALAKGQNVSYSSIDNMPATVKTVASGVYVEDLLNNIQKYTNIDVWKFSKLRFTSTDGAKGIFTYDDLFADRYYYPSLHEDGHGLNEDNEITYDVGKGTLVKPMLSIEAEQERLPQPSNAADVRVYNPEQYTILFGLSESELANVVSRTSDYKRGICQMVIDMGNYSAPTSDITGVTLDQTKVTFAAGKKLQLTATIAPTTASNQNVTWTTSNASVATVSSNGMVIGLANGTATITATSVGDNTKSATCTVTVSGSSQSSSGQTGNNNVTGIVLGKSQLTLAVNKEETLSLTVLPSSTTNYSVTWKSSDTSVAKVDNNGVVKGVKEGVAKISATLSGYTATCTVTVSNTVVAVTGVVLNNSAITMAKDKSYQLTAIINPSMATNKTVLWSSDTPGIASVDTNGLVTAKNLGSAVISVMTEDGNFTKQCKVTVSDKALNFSDVSNSWAKNDIESMISLGLISGYSDGTFKPNATITRAEFLSILIRILEKTQNIQIQVGNTFNDTVDHWANSYISTAVALNIASGYENGNFGANDNITREQIAVMIANAAGYDKNQTAVSFTDSKSISSWAVAAVSYTVNQKLFTGYENGSFGPKKNATRAEVATLLLRFYEKLNTK